VRRKRRREPGGFRLRPAGRGISNDPEYLGSEFLLFEALDEGIDEVFGTAPFLPREDRVNVPVNAVEFADIDQGIGWFDALEKAAEFVEVGGIEASNIGGSHDVVASWMR
jgi:hypothetical protein